MNGTMSRWLRGVALLAMGLALGIASVGCVTAPDGSEADDDDEQIGSASQELDDVEAPPLDGEEEEALEDPGLDEGAMDDGVSGEPQPVPWITRVRGPLPDDIDPFTTASNAPSNGQSGK